MKQKSISEIVGAAATAEGVEPLVFICSRLSAGQNLSQLATELDISRQNLSSWCNALPNARAEMKTAREEGYRAMLERAEKLLEDLGASPTREELAVAQARIDLLKWGAERQARHEWGPASAQQINVNVGALSGESFIAALRLRTVKRDEQPALPAPAADVEYSIEDGDCDSPGVAVAD